MIGKQLGNRYEVLVKIGEGGMANVYSARDTLLNRTVTVKVLKDYLVDDEDFVRRFRREAQAAAGLSHPHIINVYDVGEEDNIHYIVMEYVQGKTLKDLIQENERIPADHAAEIIKQITQAIIHAHSHRVIHRDIKPQNILVSRSGQVKVTDFGIALAFNQATVTCNEQVMGSVHYFSPEQAKGNFTGEQSDIYSLGIVFYEMLTGNVPYSGETPINVALKHLNEEITPPRELYDDIPSSLENIVLKAVQKDPAQRYETAGEFLEDVTLWQEGNKVNANTLAAEGARVETGNTQIIEPVKESGNNYSNKDIDYNDKSKNMDMQPNQHSFRAEGSRNVGKVSYKRNSKNKGRKKNTSNKVAMIAILGILILAGFFTVGYYWFIPNVLLPPEVTVPDLDGLSSTEAQEELQAVGLGYDEELVYDNEIPPGDVVAQDPSAGSTVRENRDIVVEVSQGKQAIEVPEVAGLPRREATFFLRHHELDYEIREEHDEDVDTGYVIRQDPRPEVQIYKGDEVILYVSKGVRSFPLRDLTGKSQVEVNLYVGEENLIIDQEQEEYSDEPEGNAIDQYPPPGTEVQPGDTLDITWSKGPDPAQEEEEDDEDTDIEDDNGVDEDEGEEGNDVIDDEDEANEEEGSDNN